MQPIAPEDLAPGLYIVATPIGNLRDITIRALATLSSCDVIACEDTRVTGKLLSHFGIHTKTTSYHEHNAAEKRPGLLADIQGGKRIALVSDAGTPLISDPGYKLVREAAEAGIPVTALPGASSVLTALCLAGLPTDRFLFLGFPPSGDQAVQTFLKPYAHVPATLVLLESPRRMAATLASCAAALGERAACVAREMTKLHEDIRRGTLASLAEEYTNNPESRGEAVIVIAPPEEVDISAEYLEKALRDALSRLSFRDAVAEVSEGTGAPKNEVYALALQVKATP